jgi:CRISPR-associated endonuclease/helicase Cas3
MSKAPENLLAKSKPKVSLEEHLLQTEQAAGLIFRLDGRWGQNWCRFFQIEGREAREKFLLNLRVAALFHDIGKANEDFYLAVTASGFQPQTLRHEHLSALTLCLSEVRQWLSRNVNLDIDVITAAVLSHHLKASREEKTTPNGKSYRWCQHNGKRSLTVYFDHPEVIRTLEKIAEVAYLDSFPIPKLPNIPWSDTAVWNKAFHQGTQAGDDLEDDIQEDNERRSLLVAVKAGLIVSDAAASGLVRTGKPIKDWIEDVVHSESIADNDIADAIINIRIGQIKARQEKKSFNREKFLQENTPAQLQKLQEKTLQEFQKQIARQGSTALLLAACGTGKTLGAWKWAEQQSRDYSIGKVIFLYPTRGTANEGFRDYVGWALETDAALVTGTARYELEAMQENPSEAIEGKQYQVDERLYALGFWSRRYFSATVDQFLGFLEHSYQSICLLPALADSAVIIDEVHSFDKRMFDSLISFLKNFNIPVLCMTATLPPSRRKQLIDAGLRVYPTGDLPPDLEKRECHPRYYLEPVDGFTIAFEKAVQAYLDGQRVLWVVNTVDRCIAIANKLKNDRRLKNQEAKVLANHSRFCLRHRQNVHSATIKTFELQKDLTQRKPAIAITTQVCEMSLDLDADILITEVAPIPSLVQRFGRANRHLMPEIKGNDFRAILHPYIPPGYPPYQKAELKDAWQFLKEFSHMEVSQRQLAEALEYYSPVERESEGNSRFLESGYYAIPGNFRDTDEFSVPCILDQDLGEVEDILKSSEAYRKEPYIINIPKKWVNPRDTYPSWLPKYLSVAPSEGHYDEEIGYITELLADEKLLQEVELD